MASLPSICGCRVMDLISACLGSMTLNARPWLGPCSCLTSCTALPLPYDYDALLAELLFSQMLALPQPQFKPIAYSCLIVRPVALLLSVLWSFAICKEVYIGQLPVARHATPSSMLPAVLMSKVCPACP